MSKSVLMKYARSESKKKEMKRRIYKEGELKQQKMRISREKLTKPPARAWEVEMKTFMYPFILE